MATKKKPAAAKTSEFTYKAIRTNLPNPTLNVPGVEPGYFQASGQPCRLLAPKERAAGLRSCPVQLVFVNGTPYLRLCTQAYRPGFLVKVKDGADAYDAAGRACAEAGFSVPANKKVFDRALLKRANVEAEDALGRVRRFSRGRRG